MQRAIRKPCTTVEASCRLDAIASAGFGLSRAKVVTHDQSWTAAAELGGPSARPAVNWWWGIACSCRTAALWKCCPCTRTKRERWRVELRRS